MYEGLVALLRKKYDKAPTVMEAADAIEELNKCLDGVNDAHNEGFDVGYFAGRRDYEPQWIPVTERLPEDSKNVRAAFDDVVLVAFYSNYEWMEAATYSLFFPTHWMPLPLLPKEG